jgi:uncharacterized protein YndB with AHSA1/START domain
MRGSESIDLHFDLQEAPTDVWRALTDSKLLEAWLMPNNIIPVVGHKFTFKSKPMDDWDGIAYCTLTEVVPQRKLQYQWQAKKDLATGEYGFDTLLTFTLTPNPDGGTHLHLLHEGFQAGDFAFKVMGDGWRSNTIARISAALRGEPLNARCD